MSTTKLLGKKPMVRRGLPRFYSNRLSYQELLNAESALGRTLFGPIPDGHQREFFVGVNGLATYSTLPTPPLERILLETDAPFLTPEPFRGIINEPAYIRKIAEWLSQKIGQEYQLIEVETTKNARKLFGI